VSNLAEMQVVERLCHCFYYSVNQLLTHLIPFVADARLAYHHQ